MARLARVVIPGLPHHVTQRGNGRSRVFFSDGDYALYRDLLAASCAASGVACWAWAAMPSHVHLILVPEDADGLRAALAPVHRRYAGLVNARRRRTGHFWQGRFGAVAMDESHLCAALRYVMLNPVRARLAARAQDWPWSSARAYIDGAADGLTQTDAAFSRFPDMAAFLAAEADAAIDRRLRAAETIGRPIGDAAFLAAIARQTGRSLAPRKRGPKPKAGN